MALLNNYMKKCKQCAFHWQNTLRLHATVLKQLLKFLYCDNPSSKTVKEKKFLDWLKSLE